MVKLIRILLLITLLLVIGLTALVIVSLENEPAITEGYTLSHRDVAQAKQILAHNDPRQFKRGRQQSLVISEQELDLVVRYLAQRSQRVRMRAAMVPGKLQLQATARLPISPVERYLNVELVFREAPQFVRVDSLSVGQLQVPRFVADFLFQQALKWGLDTDLQELLAHTVKKVEIQDRLLRVDIAWTDQLLSVVRSHLISDEERQRLIVYQQELGQVLDNRDGQRSVSLFELLSLLLQRADQRAPAGQFIAENRSVILTLAAYLDGHSLAVLVPELKGMPPLPARKVELLGRQDFAQHFILSAALAVTGDSMVADAVGLFKEIDDIDHGSGFSFTDLAADRAGTRFAVLATSSEHQARYVQQSFVRGLQEADIMPSVDGLPEFMKSNQFKTRYGKVGSPAYQAVMNDIERRIAACKLYVQSG